MSHPRLVGFSEYHLVSRVRDSFTISGQRLEDLIRGLVPHVGPRILVPIPGPLFQGCFQSSHASVGASSQPPVSELGKPTLDQVEPRARSRGEVQVETGMSQQPAMDGGGLVRRRVVKHDMHVELCGHGFVDCDQKPLDSMVLCRRWVSWITAPVATLSAAKRLVTP